MKISRIFAETLFIGFLAITSVLAADLVAGQYIFKKHCKKCHVVSKTQHRTGPHLVGLFSRMAGSAKGYKKYSKAIIASEIVWDETTLDSYLKTPRKYIKGTRMSFRGIKKQTDRDNVIAYLKTYSP